MTTWLPSEHAASYLEQHPRHVRRAALAGKFGAIRRERRGRNARAITIALEQLPAEAQARYYAEHPELAPRPFLQDASLLVPSATIPIESASATQRRRATLRMSAVVAYERFLAEWGSRRGRMQARARWVQRYRDEHPELEHLSVDSIQRWTSAWRAYGINGLVDRNDGSSRRGKTRIPRQALLWFRERYLDRHDPPTIARAIEDTRLHFGCDAIGGATCTIARCKLPHADDPFYRYLQRYVTEAERRALRDAVDAPSKFLPFISRAMEEPYRTLQSDHHIADVFVHCEGTVCPERCRGHRPWITPIWDVGSRKIISHAVSLDVPNSERILRAFYLAVVAEGLPERLYVDNGKDYKKAAEWKRTVARAGEFLGNRMQSLGIQVVFARPYNAQAKAIERLFGSFVSRRWKGTPGYTGALGKRSERTNHLVANPELLTPLSEFCVYLDACVVLHNTSSHRGVGMMGRTPSAVLTAWRAEHPKREPDPHAFRLVFWHHVERTVQRGHRGYVVRDRNLVYTLVDPDAEIALRFLGERVRVLINPDDIAHAIVCTMDERYLCDALVYPLASHDTRDAVTQEDLEATARAKRELYQRLRGDAAAKASVREFKRGYIAQLAALARRRRAVEEEQTAVAVAAAGPPVTVMVPSYTPISRRAASSSQAIVAAAPVLTPEQLELASRAEDHSDEFLSAALASRPRLVAPGADDAEEDDPVHLEAERARIAAVRESERKTRDGECLTCDEPAEIGAFCWNHYRPSE